MSPRGRGRTPRERRPPRFCPICPRLIGDRAKHCLHHTPHVMRLKAQARTRAAAMAKLRASGKKLWEIGAVYGITVERVRQILLKLAPVD